MIKLISYRALHSVTQKCPDKVWEGCESVLYDIKRRGDWTVLPFTDVPLITLMAQIIQKDIS